ncbi:hypothetical protein [Agromyces sp. Marseille-Q5079]|uniref:hypothetical protein n=1 Tax=Agromyces sp. Marseille-Q5079 TaxID=3439059 RepID=UPI003D9CB4C5
MTSRWARVARGGVIAAFATFVAALSHTLGGGAAPGALAVGLSFAFSVLLCIAVVGARLSAVRTVIAVAVAQFALHALYSVQGSAAVASPAHAGGHHHMTVELPLGAASASPFAYDASMLITHLAAVVVTVLAIRHGDAALRSALGAALLAVASVIRSAPVLEVAPSAPVRATSGFAAPRALAGLLHLSVMRHRGPPQVLAVV